MDPLASPARETAPERAVTACYMSPRPFSQTEDQAIDRAHQRNANRAHHSQPVHRVRGPFVLVLHAVRHKRYDPHQDVRQRVDEHEPQLLVDPRSLLRELALHVRDRTIA
jgi:hypothetical protein